MSLTPRLPRRPPRYHRRASVLWMRALRRLHGKHLPDRRIAELLSQLTEAAVRQLDREGWTIERAEDLAAPGANPLPWTEDSVRYHRCREGLPANHAGLAAANAQRLKRFRLRQADAGFWHLLPDPDTGAAGWLLWENECRVLSLLRKRGPLTRQQIADALGLQRIRAHDGRSAFRLLIEAGLIELSQDERGTVFAIAAAALPLESSRETGVESRYG